MDTVSIALISKALDCLAMRSAVTAQNIANANSAHYRPVGVSFEDRLKAAAERGAAAIALVEPRMDYAPTSPIASELRLDLELATASQTAGRFAALLDVLGRQMHISRTAVSGGQ
ncbi:hypothetical protein D1610_02175 [Sphingomonas gilva]|uniref:Flagellar basal body rod protein FlgB n=1 Tax=Sphingomonas gilva TaxID=2305907 RepID=A0A396S6C7_9SPHN|nr:hypothetical protein [Sphingomonas gilva]RHW18965.1 hypothetical protein D1610_02175 [Sphingomonas gilva]